MTPQQFVFFDLGAVIDWRQLDQLAPSQRWRRDQFN